MLYDDGEFYEHNLNNENDEEKAVPKVQEENNDKFDSFQSFVKSFSGKTSGRYMKREVCKLGINEVVACFILFIITAYQDTNYHFLYFFYMKPYGGTRGTILDFQYLFSITGFFLGILTVFLIKYWKTVTTSRKLFVKIFTIYVVLSAILLLFGLIALIALFMALSIYNIFSMGSSDISSSIVFSFFCLIPLAIRLFLSTLNIWYYNDRAHQLGDINEPGKPFDNSYKKALDSYTLKDIILITLGFPILCGVVAKNYISNSIIYLRLRYAAQARGRPATAVVAEAVTLSAAKVSSILARVGTAAGGKLSSIHIDADNNHSDDDDDDEDHNDLDSDEDEEEEVAKGNKKQKKSIFSMKPADPSASKYPLDTPPDPCNNYSTPNKPKRASSLTAVSPLLPAPSPVSVPVPRSSGDVDQQQQQQEYSDDEGDDFLSPNKDIILKTDPEEKVQIRGDSSPSPSPLPTPLPTATSKTTSPPPTINKKKSINTLLAETQSKIRSQYSSPSPLPNRSTKPISTPTIELPPKTEPNTLYPPTQSKIKHKLSVKEFRSIWENLEMAGSFECKLKSHPDDKTLLKHLKKQGFKIVFHTNSSASEYEIGLCNCRTEANEVWFLARFLVKNCQFSAVMKSEDTSIVTANVRKFALAKVLVIDSA